MKRLFTYSLLFLIPFLVALCGREESSDDVATVIENAKSLIECNDYVSAVVRLESGSELAESAGDHHNIAESSRLLGNVYIELGMVEKAEECLRTAVAESINCGEDSLVAKDRLVLAGLMSEIKKYPDAEELVGRNMILAAETADKELKNKSNAMLALIKTDEGLDYEGITIFEHLMAEGYMPSSREYSALASAYFRTGQRERAEFFLDKARVSASSRHDRKAFMAASVVKLSSSGMYKEAFELKTSIDRVEINRLNELLGSAVLSSQMALYQEKARENELLYQKWKSKTMISVLAILLLFLGAAGAVLLFKKREVERELQLTRQMEISRTLESKVKVLEEANDYRYLNEVCELKYSNTAHLFLRRLDETIEEYRKDGPSQREFEKELDRLHGGLVSQFKSDLRPSNENTKSNKDFRNETRLFSYLLAGFSDPAICVLLDLGSLSSLYSRKSRLRAKVSKSVFPSKDRYLSVIGVQK